jgi:EAL domain-containing protein (putative c-di-GMP-specific phosphodiesterase class I)
LNSPTPQFFFQDKNNTKHIIQLFGLGCKLALNDFETEVSSLSTVVNFPINIIKLDKSLLPNSDTDSRRLKMQQWSILLGCILLSKALN